MTDRRPDPVDDFLSDLGSASVPADLAASVARRIRDERPRREARTSPWMLLAATVAVLVLAAVAWVVAGPGPTPVPNPSPSAPRSAEPSVGPSASAAPSEPPSASPSAVPSPTPQPSTPTLGEWRINVPAGATGTLPLLVVDHAGTVTGVARATTAPPGLGDDGVAVAAGPDARSLVFGWTGGICDAWARLDVESGGRSFVLHTAPDVPCDAQAIGYRLVVRFSVAVDPSNVSVRSVADATSFDELEPAAMEFENRTHGFIGGTGRTGEAMVGETTDGGTSWRIDRLGSGGVVGLGLDGSGRLWVATGCDALQTDCVPGIYRRDGTTWGRLLDAQPWRLSVSGDAAFALTLIPNATGDTLGLRLLDLWLTRDGGASWASLKDPCPSDQATTAGALDGQARVVVVCEGMGATGSARKTIWRSVGDVPGRWESLSAGPDAGTHMTLDLAADGSGWMWGPRAPLFATRDGGESWTPLDVADGDVRIATGADAWGRGGGVVLVYDPDRQATLLLRTADGKAWTELASFRSAPCCGG